MRKKITKKHSKRSSVRHSKTSRIWYFFKVNLGIFAVVVTLLTASAVVFAQHTDVLGAQISMLTVGNGGGTTTTSKTAPAKKTPANVGQSCGVNSDCKNGGKTTYCDRTGKCRNYCTPTIVKYYCNTKTKQSCTQTNNANKICGATSYSCKYVNNSCGYKVPTPTPVKCTSNSQCGSNQICCTGNSIGTVACRGFANGTCQYGQCTGTLSEGDKCNANHTDHFHTFTDHTCKFVDKCVYGQCGAKCDATHKCSNGKSCSSSCQCS